MLNKLVIDKRHLNKLVSSYIKDLIRGINLLNFEDIEKVLQIIIEAFNNNKTIYILGNGGSSSISSHMACDLQKGTLRKIYDNNEKRLKVISLTDNVALITAYANDISYDNIFVQQLRNLVVQDDVVLAISGSGNSKNVIKAIKYAKKVGAKTIGLTGFSTGGKLGKIVDLSVIVQSNHYGPIEDIHQILGHIMTAAFASIKHQEDKNQSLKINKAIPYSIK